MLNPFQASQVKSTSFLPEDYVARRAQTRFTIAIMALWMIVMVGMGGAFWLINGAWKVLRTRQEGVSTEYAQESARLDQLKQLESQRAAIMGKADITAALIERVPRYAMLGELSLRRPADLKLDTFELKSTRIAPPAPPAPNSAPAGGIAGEHGSSALVAAVFSGLIGGGEAPLPRGVGCVEDGAARVVDDGAVFRGVLDRHGGLLGGGQPDCRPAPETGVPPSPETCTSETCGL